MAVACRAGLLVNLERLPRNRTRPPQKSMKLLACIAALMLLASPVVAKILITCGESHGYAYYPQQNFVTKDKSGWTADKLSKGAFSLVKKGDELDILFKDARGMNSARADGGKVSLLGVAGSNILVTVVYKNISVELYTFDLKEKVLLWTQHKYGAIINKAATYVSKCQ
jgi:hypothetical protein